MGKKVLFVASTFSHFQHFHLQYFQAFAQQGWTVDAACAGAVQDIPWVHQLVHLPFKKRMLSFSNLRACMQLRRLVARESYDLIIMHTSLAAFFSRLALFGLKNRPRTINVVHGYLFGGNSSFLKRYILLLAEKLTAPVTDLLLAMNQWDFDTAKKHQLGKRVEYINGIGVDFSRFDSAPSQDVRQKLGLGKDDFVLLYAAEFSKRKNQQHLIHAMQYLPAQVKLVLAGDGALQKDCEKLSAKLQLNKQIIFPGYIHEMASWYQMADAVVSSSRSEGLPFNIMEAMYCGKPVIASAVKGHTDLIQHGQSGSLFPLEDSKLCAEQIELLMNEKALQTQFADHAKRSVMQYSIDSVLPSVMKLYLSVFEK